jgi:quercetin 2,3-dioxygenase
MDVAPHPHIGLQTVSWLLEGEVIHNDSLGCEALMRAGELNLMTSGAGIAHSEETPRGNSGKLNGVQMWVALPDEHRNMPPLFDHYSSLPVVELPGGIATVILGDLAGHRSPARAFSSIVGAELRVRKGEALTVPFNPDFEHGLFVLDGNCVFEGQQLAHEALHYLGTNRDELCLTGNSNCRVMLIGGTPFTEPIVMWWNFVARTHEEIERAREDWMEHRRFGEVAGYKGERLPAPDIRRLAPPNPAS